MPLTDEAIEPAWQAYVATAVTSTGEKLTTYSPQYATIRDAFAAGFAARDSEILSLREDLDRALTATSEAPATVATVEPVFEAPEPEFVPAGDVDYAFASKVLRAAADEARDIERIGQTPYANILTAEAERFNEHPLSLLYRGDDTRAHIAWLDVAADKAAVGILPDTVSA